MNRAPRIRALAVLSLAAVAVLSGCAGSPEPATSTSAPSTAPTKPVTTPTPTETTAPQADPACDTIIPQDVVDDFAKVKWSSISDPFTIGETELPDGILCTWGDVEVASDHVAMYGWAPIDADTATQLQSRMLQEGWVRETGSDGIYITEDKSTVAAPDDEGYGWTYLFGDGWVKFSDTKQGIVLVEWPPAG